MANTENNLDNLQNQEYKYGFTSDVETESFPKGLCEDVVRKISAIKNEPLFMTEFRLKAYKQFLSMEAPNWAHVKFPKIDMQDIIYYSAPKAKISKDSLDEVDPEILKTYSKLGIPIEEQMRLEGIAVDAIFDSVSVANTHKKALAEIGIIFC